MPQLTHEKGVNAVKGLKLKNCQKPNLRKFLIHKREGCNFNDINVREFLRLSDTG